MEVTTKKQNRRKIVIGVLIAVVVLVAAVIAFAAHQSAAREAVGQDGGPDIFQRHQSRTHEHLPQAAQRGRQLNDVFLRIFFSTLFYIFFI